MKGGAESLAPPSTWNASILARELAQHAGETIEQALLLLVSFRPELQPTLSVALAEAPLERYTGLVKSFWPDRKFGFIQCEALAAEYEGDVFLSDQEIGGFGVGSAVSFTVTLNSKGKPQAKLLEDAAGSGQPPPAKRMRSSSGPFAPAAALQASAPPPQGGHYAAAQAVDPNNPEAVAARLEDPDARWAGAISKFFPDKQYGFIKCEALANIFGGDVFLSDQEIGSHGIGSEVSFCVHLNKQGRPQAHSLADASAWPPAQPHTPAPAAWPATPVAGRWPPVQPQAQTSIWKPAWAASGGLAHAATAATAADGEERHAGVIKSFSGNFGFISCEALAAAYGGDVFLSNQEVGGFQVGDAVTFAVAYNKNGRPQARALEPQF